ncbi:GNAT family N-acetyltransferase [Pendulispora albinea]|uniref:GNAT family N-acetyltransferase n=1 Tax=Pendulispora albinea TaxID=2741071 RepID=A0ABZ2M936_9BACT
MPDATLDLATEPTISHTSPPVSQPLPPIVPLGEEALPEALTLLEGTYWNEGIAPEAVGRAILASTVWVGAREPSGALVAMARVLSDTVKVAWIFDVIVRPDWRGKGLAQALMRAMLEHPAVRHVRKVRLGTRDAHGLYAKFGFRSTTQALHVVEMVLERASL